MYSEYRHRNHVKNKDCVKDFFRCCSPDKKSVIHVFPVLHLSGVTGFYSFTFLILDKAHV